ACEPAPQEVQGRLLGPPADHLTVAGRAEGPGGRLAVPREADADGADGLAVVGVGPRDPGCRHAEVRVEDPARAHRHLPRTLLAHRARAFERLARDAQ